jgi:hypothetical protein
MNDRGIKANEALRAVQLAIPSGLFVCIDYPLLSFVELPAVATVTLAALLGPALAVASYGLMRVLDLDAARVTSRIGAILNALAGALLCAMLLVQLAARASEGRGDVVPTLVAVWLGLDVAWDAYIALGTIFFAVAMLRHPRFGPAFAFSGMLIGAALLALNFYTFPIPPAEAELVDLGPLVGLWYLVVTIRIWGSLMWVRRAAAAL